MSTLQATEKALEGFEPVGVARFGEFVYGYLKGQDLTDTLAQAVAREASKALRSQPSYLSTKSGRVELHIRLFRVLVDAAYRRYAAELTADLLRELRDQIPVGGNTSMPASLERSSDDRVSGG